MTIGEPSLTRLSFIKRRSGFIRNIITVAKWEHHWHGSAPFNIRFNTPTVQLLCERKAILTFSLENIVFHASGDRYVLSLAHRSQMAYKAVLPQ